MTQHSKEYTEYMQSPQWAERKRKLYAKRGHVCEMCGATDTALEVHHKDYTRLGREIDDDLLIVCRECHPKADRERIEWEARRKAQANTRWATLEEVEAVTMRLVENSRDASGGRA